MQQADWILSATEQAEMGITPPPLPVCAVPESQLTEIKDLIAEPKKPSNANQLSTIQLELFELDPDHHDLRQAHFANLPRQLSDYFARRYQHRLKKYGAHYASGWFTQEMRKMLPRVDKVMQQYADVFSLYHQPWQDLSWLDALGLEHDDLPVEGETAELAAERQARENKRRRWAAVLANDPIAARLAQTKAEFAKHNLQPLCYQRPERLKQIADTLAFKMEQMQDEYCIKHQHKATNADTARAVVSELYQAQIKLCDGYHINAPYAKKGRKGLLTVEELQTGFLKLACPTFWFNKLKRAAIRMKEHLAIAVGMVSIATGGYVSCERLSAFEAQRKANYEFIKNSIITNLLDEEEQTELLDIWLKSSSNPKKRRIELMTRMNGFDQIAEHNGDEGLFITLTAPSKYHAMLENGGVNPKWNGASPNQTQQYLCGVWAKIRAELNRQHIKTYGFRVAEPHHDATPHWHLLLYARPEHIRALKRVFWHYALEEDGTEKGARKHRCTFKTIDRKKGSGAAYLAKYVSKNVDGYGMDDLKSDETGNDSKIAALRALAWASTWGIRQFQQIGGASVGVWREARKLGDIVQDDEIIDILRIIADLGDWAAYTVYQGGALALRKDLKARLHYAVYGENKYKETRKKVNGITNQLNGAITETRLKEWVISRKPANWDELKQQRLFGINGQSATAERSEAEIGGNAALGLVSVTVPVQKTDKISEIDLRVRERIKNQLILIRGRATEYQIDDLLNGKHLPIYSNEQIGIYLRYSRGQLIEEKIPKTHFH